MLALTTGQVSLNAHPANKQEAIRQVGQLLVQNGNIEAGYIDSMFGREKVANTYLGNGIAIPHGLPKDRELIRETGIAVVQVPGGVTWNEGERVHLVVGIAAKSDEHIEVLRRLTRVLGNKEQVAQLTQTAQKADIIEALTGSRPQPTPTPTPITDYPHFFDITIPNKTGFHARPATAFVDLARQFDADILVRHGQQSADGKSLISLLQLGTSLARQFGYRRKATRPRPRSRLYKPPSPLDWAMKKKRPPPLPSLAQSNGRHRRSKPPCTASPPPTAWPRAKSANTPRSRSSPRMVPVILCKMGTPCRTPCRWRKKSWRCYTKK